VSEVAGVPKEELGAELPKGLTTDDAADEMDEVVSEVAGVLKRELGAELPKTACSIIAKRQINKSCLG
jgi:hypothetical protein